MAEIVSDEFKEMCKSNTPSGALGRIIILANNPGDNVVISESTDIEDITIEDNCYVNDRFIGTAVAKKVTVNLFNDDNVYDLENKEIEVQMGFNLLSDELISFGNFIIEKPNTEEVQAITKFVGYDYMIKFNKEYVDNNTYPIALGTYFSNLCTQVGLTAGSTSFINSDYMVLGNAFQNGETCKEVLCAIAQIAGGVAKIGRDNKPYIISLSNDDEVDSIDGNNYDTFVPNNVFGPINKVIIKMQDDVEEEEAVRSNAQSIAQNGECAIIISNNPILNSAEQRELVIDNIYNNLYGITYLPFKTSYYGYPYLDSMDKIKISNVDDTEYDSYVFNHTIKYDGAFTGEIETSALTKAQSIYQDTRDLKKWRRDVEFRVDKINGEVSSVISEVDGQNTKISSISQKVDELNSKITDVADITTTQQTIYAHLEFTDINQSQPVEISIHPTTTNISYLYPSENLFPSESLFMTVRTLRFTNTTEYIQTTDTYYTSYKNYYSYNSSTEEYTLLVAGADYTVGNTISGTIYENRYIDYELPDDLLIEPNSGTYDEFYLAFDGNTCQVTKRCKYNADRTVSLLTTETINTYTYPDINLTDGDYTVDLLGYDNAYMSIRLMTQNIYTTQFATKAEMSSEISQTSTSILETVSETYATQDTASSLSSRIGLTAKSIELVTTDNSTSCGITIRLKNENGTQIDSKSANITMSGKVAFTDLSNSGRTTINGSNITTGTIDASVVNVTNISASNITTGTLNLTGHNTTITSTNFSVDRNGNITATGGTIGGFTIGSSQITALNGDYYMRINNGSGDYHDFLVVRTGTSGNYDYPFYVRADGTLYASSATIRGSITTSSGTIGGWTIDNGKITAGNGSSVKTAVMQAPSSSATWVFAAGGSTHTSYSDCPFRVDKNGNLYATSANISGTITATSGTFDYCTVKNTCSVPASTVTGTLATSNIPNLSANKITSGTMSGDRISGGIINASKLVGVSVVGDSVSLANQYEHFYAGNLEGKTTSIIVQHEGQYWRKLIFTGGILTDVLSSW